MSRSSQPSLEYKRHRNPNLRAVKCLLISTDTDQVATTQPNCCAWKRQLYFINILTWVGAVHRSFLCVGLVLGHKRLGQHKGSGHKSLFWKESLGQAIYPFWVGFLICSGNDECIYHNEALYGPGSKLNIRNTIHLIQAHIHSMHLILMTVQWSEYCYHLHCTREELRFRKDK